MAEPTQIGVQFKLGFNGAAYVGYQTEDWSDSPEAEEEIVKDDNNATATVITYDARTVVSANFLIKETGGDLTPPAKNSIIEIQGPDDVAAVARRVQTASVSSTRGVAKLSLSLIREVSMGAAYDALVAP